MTTALEGTVEVLPVSHQVNNLLDNVTRILIYHEDNSVLFLANNLLPNLTVYFEDQYTRGSSSCAAAI